MIRYEQGGGHMSRVAVFADGTRVPVGVSRTRAYPALRGQAMDTADLYQVLIARLGAGVRRVADLGCGAGAGTKALAAAGFDAAGFDHAPEAVAFASAYAPHARFEQAEIERVALAGFDALLLVDVLGLAADDEALLRAMARGVAPGTRLLGAVARAEVGQRLAAPARRAFSRESLDALLVRCGFSAPVLVAQTRGMILFEARRAATLETARAVEIATSAIGASTPSRALELVALAASAARDNSEARELLLALGELQLWSGERALAEQSFTAANAIAPDCAQPYVALAAAMQAAGAEGDAEALLDHAVGIDASNVAAWRALAGLFLARGETARAAEALDCAASLAPSDAGIARDLARLLSGLGDTAGAARALEQVLAFDGATAAVRASFGWLALGASAGAPAPRRGVTTGAFPVVNTSVPESSARRSLAS